MEYHRPQLCQGQWHQFPGTGNGVSVLVSQCRTADEGRQCLSADLLVSHPSWTHLGCATALTLGWDLCTCRSLCLRAECIGELVGYPSTGIPSSPWGVWVALLLTCGFCEKSKGVLCWAASEEFCLWPQSKYMVLQNAWQIGMCPGG